MVQWLGKREVELELVKKKLWFFVEWMEKMFGVCEEEEGGMDDKKGIKWVGRIFGIGRGMAS